MFEVEGPSRIENVWKGKELIEPLELLVVFVVILCEKIPASCIYLFHQVSSEIIEELIWIIGHG